MCVIVVYYSERHGLKRKVWDGIVMENSVLFPSLKKK